MSQEEKVMYFKAALSLVGINSDDRTCDLIISTYEQLLELKGQFSVHDAVALKLQNEAKFKDQQPLL